MAAACRSGAGSCRSDDRRHVHAQARVHHAHENDPGAGVQASSSQVKASVTANSDAGGVGLVECDAIDQ